MAFNDFLPYEAVKAILSFMSRNQLITLSRVNRQFHHVIDSPHFETKPLLIAQSLTVRRYTYEDAWWVGVTSIDYRKTGGRFAIIEVATRIEQLITPEWIRFKGIALDLYRNQELGHAWLRLIDENAHCLRAAEKLQIYRHRELAADAVELINKFRSIVRVEERLYAG